LTVTTVIDIGMQKSRCQLKKIRQNF
jgi:hypothetical protein